MSDFKINLDDLNDTASLAKKAVDGFYPGGVPLTTTDSTNGDRQRTLTQRDLQSVMAGDALYRSPNFSLQVSNHNVQSSINRNTWHARYRRRK